MRDPLQGWKILINYYWGKCDNEPSALICTQRPPPPFTHLWPAGSVWGSSAASGQRRWRSPGQRGSWRSWGRQTAGWTVPLLWSYRTRCKTELPGQGLAERRRGRWIYPQAQAAASWRLRTESHACCPPGGALQKTSQGEFVRVW